MLITLVKKSLIGNPGITVWTLATLGMSAALVVMFTTVSIEAKRKMSDALREMGANSVVHARSSSERDEEKDREANWHEVKRLAARFDAEVLILTVRIGTLDGAPVAVVVGEEAGLRGLTPYWSVSGRRSSGPRECMIGRKVADLFQIQVGETLTVDWPPSDLESRLEVAGIFESGDEDEERIFSTDLQLSLSLSGAISEAGLPEGHPPIPAARKGPAGALADCRSCHGPDGSGKFLTARSAGGSHGGGTSGVVGEGRPSVKGLPDPQSRVVRPVPPVPWRTYAWLSVPGGEAGIERLAAQLRSSGAGVTVRPLRQIVHGEETVLEKVTLLSGLTLAAVLVLASLGVTASVLARVVERRKEFALLRALGGKRRAVAVFLLSESAVMSSVASVAGFIVGTALASGILQAIFSVSATPRLSAFLAGLAATLVVALGSGLVAVRRALQTEPALALRGE